MAGRKLLRPALLEVVDEATLPAASTRRVGLDHKPDLLVASSFMQRFGQATPDAATTNFFVETQGLSGDQVLWLEGIREIPGLILISPPR